MKRCPVCDSKELYDYKKYYQYGAATGEEILPKLARGFFSVAKIRPTVCADCGHIALFASEDARRMVEESEHWKPASAEMRGPIDRHRRRASHAKPEGEIAERDVLILKLEERVRVLERIATDDSARLRAEIDSLRDTPPSSKSPW